MHDMIEKSSSFQTAFGLAIMFCKIRMKETYLHVIKRSVLTPLTIVKLNKYFVSVKRKRNLCNTCSGWSRQGTYGTGKTGKMDKKCCQNTGKTQGILSKHRENTGNFVSSSCKCSDSKSKGYCNSCRKKNPFLSRSWIGLPSQFCVCNTHKLCKLAHGKFAVAQGKHREFEKEI